ncbi:MAG: Wzz/FepE/Etk N-terminal domain-containing protein [Actinomycetota bacterium]
MTADMVPGATPKTVGWEPGLGDHLRTIWRRKWIILAGAALIAEAVFIVLTFAVTPRYESEASIRLTVETGSGLLLDDNRVEYATRIYAELAESPAMLADAVDRSGVALEEGDRSAAFAVQWASPPGFIDVTASADTAEDASRLADGMAAALVARIGQDSEQLTSDDGDTVPGDGAAALAAVIVEPAETPSAAASPSPLRDSVAAFVIALVVLAEAAAIWRPIRGLLPTSRTAERVSELVGIPSLTLTGDPEDRTRLGLFAARHLSSSEAFVVVQNSGGSWPAVPIRLAEALTVFGRRTLVVDADPNEPAMHRWLALPRQPGLSEVAAGDDDLATVVFESQAGSELALLTAGGDEGPRDPIPTDRAMDLLTPGYDCVVAYVGPAANLDGVAASIAALRRSTVLVVDPDRTTRRRLAELVHGYGGYEDVVAILLMTRSATKAETSRLSARWWKRGDTEAGGSSAEPQHLGAVRDQRRAS